MIRTEDYLRELLTIFFSQKRIILTTTALIFAAAVAIGLFWPPTYEVSSAVLIKSKRLEKSPEALEKTELRMQRLTSEDLKSEARIMTSPEVIRKAVGALREDGRAYTGGDGDKAVPGFASQVGGGLETTVLPDSNIVEISYRDKDPRRAFLTLKAVLKAYTSQRAGVFNPEQMETFFSDQVSRFSKGLRLGERELKDLATASGSPNAAKEIENNLMLKAELEREFQLTKNIYLEKKKFQEFLERALASKKIQFFSALENLSINDLASKLQELVVERGKLLRTYQPASKPMQRIDEQIATLSDTLRREVATYADAHRSRVLALEDKMASLRQELIRIDRRNLDLHRDFMAWQRIQLDLDLNKHSYETFARRLEETRINTSTDADTLNSISVISRPVMPTSPVFPKKGRVIPFGLVAGFIAGCCLGFLKDYLDHTFKRPEDVERYAHLPTIFSIPILEK